MNKLSVVIITFNEVRNIGRCLKSVQNIADEIIVLDSFSTDNTKGICQSFEKVKFIEREWKGFSKSKNFANSQASFELILSMDADEALSSELESSIMAVKQSLNNDAYALNRLNNYCGKWVKHSGWYPDRKIRLFKKGVVNWEGKVHESLKFNENLSVGFINGDLLHYTYYSINEHIAQLNRFTDIGAEEAFAAGQSNGLLKIIFSPLWKFIRDYFFNKGFLDGYVGFVICIISAHSTFIKYIKIRELQNRG